MSITGYKLGHIIFWIPAEQTFSKLKFHQFERHAIKPLAQSSLPKMAFYLRLSLSHFKRPQKVKQSSTFSVGFIDHALKCQELILCFSIHSNNIMWPKLHIWVQTGQTLPLFWKPWPHSVLVFSSFGRRRHGPWFNPSARNWCSQWISGSAAVKCQLSWRRSQGAGSCLFVVSPSLWSRKWLAEMQDGHEAM